MSYQPFPTKKVYTIKSERYQYPTIIIQISQPKKFQHLNQNGINIPPLSYQFPTKKVSAIKSEIRMVSMLSGHHSFYLPSLWQYWKFPSSFGKMYMKTHLKKIYLEIYGNICLKICVNFRKFV